MLKWFVLERERAEIMLLRCLRGGGTVFAPPYSQLIYKEVSFTAEGVLITGWRWTKTKY